MSTFDKQLMNFKQMQVALFEFMIESGRIRNLLNDVMKTHAHLEPADNTESVLLVPGIGTAAEKSE